MIIRGIHPARWFVDMGASFCRKNVSRLWDWPLTTILCKSRKDWSCTSTLLLGLYGMYGDNFTFLLFQLAPIWPWRWGQCVPPQRWVLSTILHSVLWQNHFVSLLGLIWGLALKYALLMCVSVSCHKQQAKQSSYSFFIYYHRWN
jgi:hypothetical protein